MQRLSTDTSQRRQGFGLLNGRKVMNGTYRAVRIGISSPGLPERYGLHTSCCNHADRWCRNGDWPAVLERLPGIVNGDDDQGVDSPNSSQTWMIDSSGAGALSGGRIASGLRIPATGTKPGRVEHREPCGRGGERAIDASNPVARSDGRPHRRQDGAGRYRCRRDADRGQGRRQQCHVRSSRRCRSDRRPPLHQQPCEPGDAQPRGVCDAQSARAVVQQIQGILANCRPIWRASPSFLVRGTPCGTALFRP